jgi:aryl-alcohol dehydrogenase-like predicted oxidoreductase
MTFGGQCGEAAARLMVDACVDHGVNFIDTANVYCGGASEEITGRILEGRRNRFILASKIGIPSGDAPDQKGLSCAAILRGIDESLRRLRTDYLDLYYLHQPDYTVPIEESLEAMQELVTAGKVRYCGASNYAAWQICHMRSVASSRGLPQIRIAQPMYNLLSRGVEQEFFPMARALDVFSIVYNPLAGGLLTGKHINGAPQSGTRFDGNSAYMNRYWHSPNHEAVAKLHSVACADGRSLVSLSLNWILHHSPADGVVLGASRLEQFKENLAALNDGPLAPYAVSTCNDVWSMVRGIAPQYNR